MHKVLLLLFLIPAILFAQKGIETSLDSIQNTEDAKAFIKSNSKDIEGKLITFNKEKHKSKLATELLNLSKGGKKVIKTETGKTIYKVIDKKTTSHYRASIMLFDGNKTPVQEINSLRSYILKGIRNGEHKFHNLARVYSVHPTAKTGGDLGWVKKGTFSKRFEKAIADKPVGYTFSFDEYPKRHYVLQKTEDDKTIEEITVLKIVQKK
ncbi:MAG: hypothetical protein ED556_07420 [Winogradskyella sp.]|uniref:peptidylprolyl isomerase n=1 Tax=Winogradskyella sp. TaxID=1883156 RepID=UPI000F3CAE47|nr:peptidylprolyl isomerase [Winogradskyella sp.]RNC87241.1 MAG: hypothetical protein ED556_07420 [Winogradskyella sp.]